MRSKNNSRDSTFLPLLGAVVLTAGVLIGGHKLCRSYIPPPIESVQDKFRTPFEREVNKINTSIETYHPYICSGLDEKEKKMLTGDGIISCGNRNWIVKSGNITSNNYHRIESLDNQISNCIGLKKGYLVTRGATTAIANQYGDEISLAYHSIQLENGQVLGKVGGPNSLISDCSTPYNITLESRINEDKKQYEDMGIKSWEVSLKSGRFHEITPGNEPNTLIGHLGATQYKLSLDGEILTN